MATKSSGSQSEFYPILGACSSPTIILGEPLKGKIGSPQLVLVHYQICEVRGKVKGEKFRCEVVISNHGQNRSIVKYRQSICNASFAEVPILNSK